MMAGQRRCGWHAHEEVHSTLDLELEMVHAARRLQGTGEWWFGLWPDSLHIQVGMRRRWENERNVIKIHR